MFEALGLTGIAIFLGCLLVAMTFHEVMHGYVAFRLGDDTAHNEGRLTLNPLKHIDIYVTILLPLGMLLLGLAPILAAKPVPFTPWKLKHQEWGVALVGIAGPLTNLVLAIIVAAFMHVSGVAVGTLAFSILSMFVTVNVALFTFNMLPIPPLDGSRVLYAFAPEPVQKIMAQIESAGFMVLIVILVVLLPVVGPFMRNINQFVLQFLL